MEPAAPCHELSPAPRVLLSARDVHKQYGKKVVLTGVDLAIRRGEAVALTGENGAGKTTLLRICASLLRPDRGAISVQGRLGYCPQEPGLLDPLTPDEHLAYFGAALGMSRSIAFAEGRRLLAEFGFRPTGDVAKHLSGGNQQKLNLVLVLLGEPQVPLLDETYQGFDHGTYVNFWDHVDSWRVQGKAIVIVTHLLAELERVDRVVALDAYAQLEAELTEAGEAQ